MTFKPSTQLDYSILERHSSKPQYKFSETKHLFTRLAFDVFKLNDGSSDDLWKIESTVDGDYLVALYDNDSSVELAPKQASKNLWQVEVQPESNELHLFYKGTPIHRFAHPDARSIRSFLPAKLASDQNFRKALLQELSPSRQSQILKLYPELA